MYGHDSRTANQDKTAMIAQTLSKHNAFIKDDIPLNSMSVL